MERLGGLPVYANRDDPTTAMLLVKNYRSHPALLAFPSQEVC